MIKPDDRRNTSALIDRIQQGDTAAFQTLVAQYQRLVAHVVFRLVSNAADREDLCQDVFLKVYQNIGAFRRESKLSTWIARIAYNLSLNYLKKKKVPLFDDHTPGEMTIQDISVEQSLPDDFVESVDLSARLESEITKLDPRYRTILTLFHLDGQNYAEIGTIMDLPEGTVKSYLFRARKKLKEQLLVQYQREEL